MSDFGIQSTGFVLKRFQNIKSDLQAAYQGLYNNPNLADDSIIGQRIVLNSNDLAQCWEGLQLAYNAPFAALTDEGSIDNVMAAAGLTRKPATATVVTVDCVFSGAATIPTGALVQNSAGVAFELLSAINAAGAGTIQATFACTVTGAVPCPTGTTLEQNQLSIVNGVNGWSAAYLSETASVQGNAGTYTAGSITGTINGNNFTQTYDTSKTQTLTDLASAILAADTTNLSSVNYNSVTDTISITPKTGCPAVLSVFNSSAISGTQTFSIFYPDTVLGTNLETLTAARTRLAKSRYITGAGTIESIRSAIANLATVTACMAIENTTLATDGNGMPPKSVQFIVAGNETHQEQQSIAAIIWVKRAGGIQNYGNIQQIIIDSTGHVQPVFFSYVTAVVINMVVDYYLSTEETPPSDISAAITAAISLLFPWEIGDDCLAGRVLGACYSVQGIKKMTIKLNSQDTYPGSGTSPDVSISSFQQAILGTITINQLG